MSVACSSQVPEGWLEVTVASLNASRQALLPGPARADLAERARLEQQQLAGLDVDRSRASLSEAEKKGRQTGAVEWRRRRGELGEAAAPGGEGGGEGSPAGGAVVRVCGAVGSVARAVVSARV